MEITYRLVNLSQKKFYAYGENAASPELAKLCPGNIHRKPGDRLGIELVEWEEDERRGGKYAARRVLVEVESAPGAWVIGV